MAYIDNFSKLDWALEFNRTGKFPLDRSSMFGSYADALAYAKQDGSDSRKIGGTSYVGQIVSVFGPGADGATDEIAAYIITAVGAGASLMKFAQSSASGDVEEEIQALGARITTIEDKLKVATTEADGFLSKEDFAKLAAIEENAQVNKIEVIQVDGTALPIGNNKNVNIDLAGALEPYAKSADVTTELGKKADASTVTALEGKVTKNTEDISTINTKLTGLTGAMHFVGTSTTDPMGESGATVEGHETFESGDVCLFGNKEFVYNGAAWVELGDEGSHLTKTEAAETYLKKTDAANTYITADKAAEDIAAAKQEAITEAGTAADGKITEALKDYTKTTDLNTALDAKAAKSDLETTEAKATANAAAIKVLQDVGAEKNVVQTVSEEFELSAERELSVKAIDKSKVTGLETALDNKVDKANGQRLITADEATKLGKLTLKDDGSMEVDGTISSDNVEEIDTWIEQNRDTVAGLYKAADETKLAGIAAGAQVNVIEKIKVNGADLTPDAEKRVDLGSLATTTAVEAAKQAADDAATAAAEAKAAVETERERATGVEATLAVKADVDEALAKKQDTLTKGAGINIAENVISIDLSEIILDGGSASI